jgi:hypothetical protein
MTIGLPVGVSCSTTIAAPGRKQTGQPELLCPVFLQQFCYTVRQLRTLLAPEIRTLGIDPQALFSAGGDRVKKSDALDIAAIPAIAAVGYHDVVKGALLGTTT